MATKKKKTTAKKLRKPRRQRRRLRRFGISIFCGKAHVGWLGAHTEEERDTIINKAKKNALVDHIEVIDRKEKFIRDAAYETHLKVNKRWKIVRSADFMP